MSDTPKPISLATGTVLGIDFSQRRIGVAIASTITGMAQPLTILHNPADGGVNWSALSDLIAQWKPVAVVVGLPLTADDGEQDETRAARRFGQRVHGRYHVPVYWQDERYTTQDARDAGRDPTAPRGSKHVDAVAAQLILQSWLDGVAQTSSNGVQ